MKRPPPQNRGQWVAIFSLTMSGISTGTINFSLHNKYCYIDFISKATFVANGKVVKGYKLNGNTIEDAFGKARTIISKNLNETSKMITDLQKLIKNEKIKESMRKD